MKKKTGQFLARFYKINVCSAYYHEDGNWYWPLKVFPGAYFDGNGCVIFQTEKDFCECVYLGIGPTNVWIRGQSSGLGISDIPGYMKLNPRPSSL
jgi:hypothetical protein